MLADIPGVEKSNIKCVPELLSPLLISLQAMLLVCDGQAKPLSLLSLCRFQLPSIHRRHVRLRLTLHLHGNFAFLQLLPNENGLDAAG